jgi:hypothetical protein
MCQSLLQHRKKKANRGPRRNLLTQAIAHQQYAVLAAASAGSSFLHIEGFGSEDFMELTEMQTDLVEGTKSAEMPDSVSLHQACCCLCTGFL